MCAWVRACAYTHVHVEVRGPCQVLLQLLSILSFGRTLHWTESSLVWLGFLPNKLQSSLLWLPELRFQAYATAFIFSHGWGRLNSSPCVDWEVNTDTWSLLQGWPEPSFILRNPFLCASVSTNVLEQKHLSSTEGQDDKHCARPWNLGRPLVGFCACCWVWSHCRPAVWLLDEHLGRAKDKLESWRELHSVVCTAGSSQLWRVHY